LAGVSGLRFRVWREGTDTEGCLVVVSAWVGGWGSVEALCVEKSGISEALMGLHDHGISLRDYPFELLLTDLQSLDRRFREHESAFLLLEVFLKSIVFSFQLGHLVFEPLCELFVVSYMVFKLALVLLKRCFEVLNFTKLG
jgi:hypothetical protein